MSRQRWANSSGPLPAKRFARRTALRAMGAAALGSLAPPAWPGPLAGPAPASGAGQAGWRPLASGPTPRALAPAEIATLEPLVERILPATDTPGAAAAGVHWYLDLVAEAEPATKRRLQAGLAQLDERAGAMFGSRFADTSEARQVRVLEALSGEGGGAEAVGGPASPDERAFFDFLKARVVDAYYRSEAGQLGELQWVGHEFHDTFAGACPHPDPLVHPRPGRAGARLETAAR